MSTVPRIYSLFPKYARFQAEFIDHLDADRRKPETDPEAFEQQISALGRKRGFRIVSTSAHYDHLSAVPGAVIEFTRRVSPNIETLIELQRDYSLRLKFGKGAKARYVGLALP